MKDNQLSVDDAVKMVSDALANGKEASVTSKKLAAGMYAADSKNLDIKIVTELDTNEVSSLSTTPAAAAGKAFVAADLKGGTALAAGDKVTLNGESITATTSDPVNMSVVKDVVKSLQNGDQMKIGTKDITIADKTNMGGDKYTIDDVLALLNDKDEVKFDNVTSAEGKAAMLVAGLDNQAHTAVETKVASSDDNVISVKDAYSKMAEELAKASSIGADTAATVKSNNSGEFTIKQGSVEVKDALAFNLHVGADADMTNKINVDIESMSAAGLGIKGLNVKDATGTAATYAIDAIADAVAKVSSQRSALGAVQNRLEHTIANVDNVVENTTSAESRIRDTDMAETMVEYSKNNILAQAGQSMLAQANQANQGVLSLLQ